MSRVRGTSVDPPEPGMKRFEALFVALSLAAFAALASAAVLLPAAPSALADLAVSEMGRSGLGNPVTAVLLDFRAFDTLLETAVLVLALTGLWSLTPDAGWVEPGTNFLTRRAAEPQLALMLEVLAPLVVLTAVYLLWLGADEPGGAFQAGTLLAAVGVLLVAGKVVDPPPHGAALVRIGLVAGFLVFALAGLLTAWLGPGFLHYPVGWTKAIIVPVEVTLAISIAFTLFMLVNGLPERRLQT